MVVCGQVEQPNSAAPALLDELSALGKNTIAEFYQERRFLLSESGLEQFDLKPAVLKDLAGSNAKANAEIVLSLLNGKETGPKRDAVLLNAAAALFVAHRAKTLIEGWDIAADILASSAAAEKLEELRSFSSA